MVGKVWFGKFRKIWLGKVRLGRLGKVRFGQVKAYNRVVPERPYRNVTPDCYLRPGSRLGIEVPPDYEQGPCNGFCQSYEKSSKYESVTLHSTGIYARCRDRIQSNRL